MTRGTPGNRLKITCAAYVIIGSGKSLIPSMRMIIGEFRISRGRVILTIVRVVRFGVTVNVSVIYMPRDTIPIGGWENDLLPTAISHRTHQAEGKTRDRMATLCKTTPTPGLRTPLSSGKNNGRARPGTGYRRPDRMYPGPGGSDRIKNTRGPAQAQPPTDGFSGVLERRGRHSGSDRQPGELGRVCRAF